MESINMALKVSINEALALSSFDNLPATSFVRLPVVRGLLGGISAATVWRMVKVGTLRTHKLTPRTTTFNVGELRALLSAKAV
jgi:predicted DNA-binding transcriptional regulator AlpA